MDDIGNRNDPTASQCVLSDDLVPSETRLGVEDPLPASDRNPAGTATEHSNAKEASSADGDQPERRSRDLRPPMGMVGGVLFGLASAVLYTAANIALRRCVGIDPFLVSAVKAGPTVIVLGPFLGWMLSRGETLATSGRMVPRFMFAALVGQFVGNAAFQFSLGMIGLAVAVPITLGTMIVGAAILGRWLLHEPVRLRTAVAMVVLIGSVVVLSLPSGAMTDPSEPSDAGRSAALSSASQVWLGSLFAASSGVAYALFGTVMRQALTGGLSAPLTMFISGSVGTVSLWTITFLRNGFGPLAAVETGDWGMMFAAGIFNFTAFVALAVALKALPVVAVNLINASQVAMAALAGIVLFAEPVTASLVIGIALTFAGLGILAGNRKRPATRSTSHH
jgi:drug/metabolite transporter (DMT)-like permease